MKVAVVVVNFNDRKDTIHFVRAITSYQVINRIVVVDNCSTEPEELEVLKELEDEKVTIIQSDRNGGYNAGNNFGIKFLEEKGEKYDAWILSNPDIEVEEKAIEKCLQVLEEDPQVGIVAPRMVNGKRCSDS